MHAVRIAATGGPEVLHLEELPDPTPGAGEALVAVEVAGVNFIDIYIRSGLYPRPLPLTLGQEGAGTVLAVGPGVQDVRPGDRVAWCTASGSYATHAVVPADRLVPVPGGVTTRLAGAVLLQGLTAHYLACTTAPLAAGRSCVVHAAAGGVGLLLCQIARMCGAFVIATVSTEEKARLAREAGAQEVILYGSVPFEEEVHRITRGAKVDVVYDSVGRDTFHGSLACLKPRGTLVLYGQSSGPVAPIDPQILAQGGSLYLTRPALHHYVATREELLARYGDLLGWVEDGSLRVQVGLELPLEAAGEAQARLARRETTGKVLLVPPVAREM